MLSTPRRVEWALITYTDWWQPSTSSIYEVRKSAGTVASDGMPVGLLETLSLRDELCWRMRQISDRDRRLLYLWYLRQLPVQEIAQDLRISRRQCFRRRSAAIRKIVELGTATDAA
jgi:DNA-directed RNA polymerase specialized sigma subunit